MEWLPKLYDSVDSLAFELRMRWAGHGGAALRGMFLLFAVLVLSAVSSVFRNLVIAGIGSFMLAEIAAAKVRRDRSNRTLAISR